MFADFENNVPPALLFEGVPKNNEEEPRMEEDFDEGQGQGQG